MFETFLRGIPAKHFVVISISLPSNHTFTFEPQPDEHPLDLIRFNTGTFHQHNWCRTSLT